MVDMSGWKRGQITEWMDLHCTACKEYYQYNWSKKKLLEYIERNSDSILVEDKETTPEPVKPDVSISQRIDALEPMQKLMLVSMCFQLYSEVIARGNIVELTKAVASEDFQRHLNNLKEVITTPDGEHKYLHILSGIENLSGTGKIASETAPDNPTTMAERRAAIKKQNAENMVLAEAISVANIKSLVGEFQAHKWAEGGTVTERHIKDDKPKIKGGSQ